MNRNDVFEGRTTGRPTGRRSPHSHTPVGLVVAGLALALLLVPTSIGAVVSDLRAPQPPVVAPVIRQVYPSDSDGNRIADNLEARLAAARAFSVLTGADRAQKNRRRGDETVAVELVFQEPVTQAQIDAFRVLGGEITYLFKAVSYGWEGRLNADDVSRLPQRMGSSLVLVAPVYEAKLYMDMASQTGRVRPIWQSGFTDSLSGIHGDPNTTIAFVDSGIDDTHPDLAGRGVHWNDVSMDNSPHPIDYNGHGSIVAAVALGTGQAGGADDGELRYTYSTARPSWAHFSAPIALPAGATPVTSQAYWNGASASLDHILWRKGTDMEDLRWIGTGRQGVAPASYTNTIDASAQDLFSAVLANWSGWDLNAVVIVNSVPQYPGVGDGFNKFRGVAPGCKWAATKLYTRNGSSLGSGLATAVDDLVVHRITKRIKIINVSSGLYDEFGHPAASEAIRDKVATAARNGILVVAAAGNSADEDSEILRTMADPAGAAAALTVGATGDENALTSYSTYGFTEPGVDMAEDFKPDVVAPGGSYYYTALISAEAGPYDVFPLADKEPNDYTTAVGTSFASPFVAGCAALVIDAMTQRGLQWDFHSDRHPRYVKMLLCATASETYADRENGKFHPTLERASDGPEGYPEAKDRYEGYGIVNPDAAVEAASLSYTPGDPASEALGPGATGRRVWARTVNLTAGRTFDVSLNNPPAADFDLYLYSAEPTDTGTPVVLAASTDAREGLNEAIHYTPDSDMAVLLVVKRVWGSGVFELNSIQSGSEGAGSGG